jgi:hypothetical protein
MTLRYDLRLNQGETFRLSVPVLDADGNGDPAVLTGTTTKAQIRTHAASSTVLYEWSSANGNVSFNVNNIVLTIPAVDSALWTFRSGVWALELSDNTGATTRLVDGLVIVHPEITR